MNPPVSTEREFGISRNGSHEGEFFYARTWPELRQEVSRRWRLNPEGLEFYDWHVDFPVSAGDPPFDVSIGTSRWAPPLRAVQAGHTPIPIVPRTKRLSPKRDDSDKLIDNTTRRLKSD
jgi:hypothetical protein